MLQVSALVQEHYLLMEKMTVINTLETGELCMCNPIICYFYLKPPLGHSLGSKGTAAQSHIL